MYTYKNVQGYRLRIFFLLNFYGRKWKKANQSTTQCTDPEAPKSSKSRSMRCWGYSLMNNFVKSRLLSLYWHFQTSGQQSDWIYTVSVLSNKMEKNRCSQLMLPDVKRRDTLKNFKLEKKNLINKISILSRWTESQLTASFICPLDLIIMKNSHRSRI